MYHLNILGCRGIPAAHGGFETFAERLALYLVNRGWTVSVYCQNERVDGPADGFVTEDSWNGVHRRHVFVKSRGALGTIEFDWKATRDVLDKPGIDLVLGYNTAVFQVLQMIRRRRVAINMDGIEWRRQKWSVPAKIWFYLNEWIGAHVGTELVADHPEIARHLATRGRNDAVMIPYGADEIAESDSAWLAEYGLEKNRYVMSVARIEPENSVLAMVRAFSRAPRGMKLLVLGQLTPQTNKYHRDVLAAASDEVIFPGGIYDGRKLSGLRFFCRAYLHGHTVGGTNPSLVEALGAGNAVIAHDNHFNRWTTGGEQWYFKTEDEFEQCLRDVLASEQLLLAAKESSRRRFRNAFQWDAVLHSYESLLTRMVEAAA